MTVKELRKELKKLIKKGSTDKIVYFNDGASGLLEVIELKEDFNVWDGDHIQLL